MVGQLLRAIPYKLVRGVVEQTWTLRMLLLNSIALYVRHLSKLHGRGRLGGDLASSSRIVLKFAVAVTPIHRHHPRASLASKVSITDKLARQLPK